MPKQLFGGIKGRNMSEVFSRVQLEIDFAKQQNTDLIGLKLDKSKCFDRLIPSVTSSLFLAFGVPVTVVTFFIQMYTNLRRFLAYKEWISPTSTTAANGLIQGCSMSLLAINVHMAVWAIFMDRIPHVNSSVFIDDSYLWAKAVNVASLQMAIQTTESWDALVGQLLNARKCQVWATSPASRRIAQHNWPNMQHSTNLEILGARIQLSDQLNYEWPQPKTDKILRDLQLIRAIPCSRAIHEHLISTKVTPQLTFAAQINCIPKKALSAIHNSVANVLWKNRPKWRSKGLLTCLLAKPHRIDPFVARAYASILDCITYLKSADQTHREMWVQLYETDVLPKNSLMAHFLQACEFLILNCVALSGFHCGIVKVFLGVTLQEGTWNVFFKLQQGIKPTLKLPGLHERTSMFRSIFLTMMQRFWVINHVCNMPSKIPILCHTAKQPWLALAQLMTDATLLPCLIQTFADTVAKLKGLLSILYFIAKNCQLLIKSPRYQLSMVQIFLALELWKLILSRYKIV